jgi:hypothetical protein
MHMSRLRPLDPPHKGIRNALGQASISIDSLDCGSIESIDDFRVLIHQVATILHDHAQQEDNYIFAPAERVQPGLTHTYSQNHEELHNALVKIVADAEALNVTSSQESIEALGLAFHQFHRDYLEHMIDEEKNIETVLLSHFSDEDLMADQGEIMSQMPFETLLLWFRFIVPSRSISDNRQVLSGFSASAPPEAVEAVRAVLRDVLPPERFAAITNNL